MEKLLVLFKLVGLVAVKKRADGFLFLFGNLAELEKKDFLWWGIFPYKDNGKDGVAISIPLLGIVRIFPEENVLHTVFSDFSPSEVTHVRKHGEHVVNIAVEDYFIEVYWSHLSDSMVIQITHKGLGSVYFFY